MILYISDTIIILYEDELYLRACLVVEAFPEVVAFLAEEASHVEGAYLEVGEAYLDVGAWEGVGDRS